MFGLLLVPTPTPTPSKPTPPTPPPTPGTCTGADMAVSRQNNTVQDTQLEVLLNGLSHAMHGQALDQSPWVTNHQIAENKKHVLGGVIFTHPPSLVGANLLVNTHTSFLKLV